MPTTSFDFSFWKKQLAVLGYPLSESKIPTQFLRDRRAIPSGVNLKEAKLVYQDPLGIDIIVLEFDRLPTRIGASRIARYWKAHQGGRQFLIFTDGIESYSVVIPGAIENPDTKLRILSLSEKLYRTDTEALESLKYTGDSKSLREQYDQNFLPYEKVRKDFFEAYRSLYGDTVEVVEPALNEYSNSYAQRFLGRLMFLYFLQRKGWLKQDKSFVDSIKDYSELNWVFYIGLSTEGNPGLPYLDGTLFEREEYLTPEKEEMIKDGMNKIFRRARELFNQYNFTVDELSPREIEVSLDPAMIGTIFENMLPEHERGSKGTFYTPPEEISFICRRALVSYLKIPESVEKIGENEVLKDGISSLIEKLNQEKSEKEVRDLRERILSITVLDPAVGSGGFLLGMMQEMVDLLRQADESVGWNPDMDQYKSRILQNLFGFDIEDEAIEIARLRIWLSMIVDKKETEALQSLDLNIVKISDSLVTLEGVQRKLGDELESTWDEMRAIRDKFAKAKRPDLRVKLRNELQRIQIDIEKKTGVKGGIIESWVPKPVDIVVMNPPYVRQESIPKDKKNYYTSVYKIGQRSDRFCYFVLRALKLVNQSGIVSVISSDKWLETEYGEDLQKVLSSRLISVYGQRDRTFDADVNSVIFVYSSDTDSSKTTDFIYLGSYPSLSVRNHIRFRRQDLKPGKWFYLRAPKMFMEKIYPKLTHKLGDFAEIKRGFTTGANDFFYMKDISSRYEADYLANPKQFEDWGVSAKNEKELREHELIYIENEGRERFVVNRADVILVARSPREINNYIIDNLRTYVLFPPVNIGPGLFSIKYIQQAMKREYIIQKGNRKGEKVLGIHNLQSVSINVPNWYNLRRLDPCNLISNEVIHDRLFTNYSRNKILSSDMFVMIYPKSAIIDDIFLLMNSTIFYLLKELFGKRMGGGALKLQVDDYERIPAPNIQKLDLRKIGVSFDRGIARYFEEINMPERRKLDEQLFKEMGIENISLDEFYKEFVNLVEDRLIKANRGLKLQEASSEQDN